MFQSARVRLTLWYVALMMLTSIIFSSVIFGIVSHQIEGFIQMQNVRIQHAPSFQPPDFPGMPLPPPIISTADLRNQEQQLLITLIYINIGILIVTGGAGYILAGRTLQPIRIMVDEQNQFISNSSHELRTPIATMRAEMEASLLEKTINETQARNLIKSNLEELGSLQILMNNLLRLAQIHNTNAVPDKQVILLADVIRRAQKIILPLAKTKHITIQTKGNNERVGGDLNSLVETFIIVLDNAIKYSPRNTRVSINTVEKNDYVISRISDEGIGIPPKDLLHIFERFYRADKSRSQTVGYGLGLSIAQKIMDIHGGTITVESHEGKGTTFILSIPKLM